MWAQRDYGENVTLECLGETPRSNGKNRRWGPRLSTSSVVSGKDRLLGDRSGTTRGALGRVVPERFLSGPRAVPERSPSGLSVLSLSLSLSPGRRGRSRPPGSKAHPQIFCGLGGVRNEHKLSLSLSLSLSLIPGRICETQLLISCIQAYCNCTQLFMKSEPTLNPFCNRLSTSP